MSIPGAHRNDLVSVEKPNVSEAYFAPMHVPDVDLLDPEAMIAFFSAQMSDVRQKLGAAMNDQQTRNDKMKVLQAIESDLVRFKEKGVGPGDPGWDTFKNDVASARAIMGDSLEGTKLDEMMKKTEGGGEIAVYSTYQSQEMKQYLAEHPDAKVQAQNGGYKITATRLPGRLDPNDVDSMVQQVKGYKDSLQNDNTMNMIRVQQLVESSSQLTNLCSNIMKKLSDSAMAPINNMR